MAEKKLMLALSHYKDNKNNFLYITLLLFLFLNVWPVLYLKKYRANDDILFIPEVPELWKAKFLSMGDDALFFHISSLRLQNFADALGVYTSLADYDFMKIKSWLLFLSNFDDRSSLIPSIAAYYYGAVSSKEKKILIAEYLENYAIKDFNKRWWWMTQAIALAVDARDDYYALQLAKSFENYEFDASEEVPTWAKFLPVIYTAKIGEKEKAYQMLKIMAENAKDLNKYDYNYMNYFIEKRLKDLNIQEKFAPR